MKGILGQQDNSAVNNAHTDGKWGGWNEDESTAGGK